jgi:hypothetical protein
LESALIVTLPAGNFTAIAGGLGPDPTGVAVIEIYNLR